MNRYEATKKCGLIGIIGNVFLLLLKGSVGLIFNSQSMIADAANSAGDIFASLMTWIGNRISSTPQDENHNFGHGKAEYIFSLFISISMIAVAFKLLYDSMITLISGSTLEFSWLLVFVCIITIVVKFCLYLYTNNISKKYNNILVEANCKDHRNDCIVTTFTLISILTSLIGITWVDGVVGICISIWIAFTGIKIFIESYNILMDKSIDEITKDLILNYVRHYKEIKKIDYFSSTPVGYQYVIVLTIFVDGNMTTFKSHELADNLEKDINSLDKVYNTIIHVNPI
ncbi:MAG: cation transporter [Clostridiaceae bacterium]|nr:cation transporter [Clostridiaceae bacterium]